MWCALTSAHENTIPLYTIEYYKENALFSISQLYRYWINDHNFPNMKIICGQIYKKNITILQEYMDSDLCLFVGLIRNAIKNPRDLLEGITVCK